MCGVLRSRNLLRNIFDKRVELYRHPPPEPSDLEVLSEGGIAQLLE
jgi:hypothetical protein